MGGHLLKNKTHMQLARVYLDLNGTQEHGDTWRCCMVIFNGHGYQDMAVDTKVTGKSILMHPC